jgi:hypothetical protein
LAFGQKAHLAARDIIRSLVEKPASEFLGDLQDRAIERG